LYLETTLRNYTCWFKVIRFCGNCFYSSAQPVHDVVASDVKTVKQRRSDVIRTSCAGWVASRCIHGYTLILKFREICCPLSRKEFFKNCYSRSL